MKKYFLRIGKMINQIVRKICHPVRLFFESDLERAVRKEEFVFYYQPELDLKTGRVVGVEALLRWRHPDKGMINPGEFIPMLEKTKLINKLTPFLFRQTMEDLTILHQNGYKDLFMSVNLSVIQLEDSKTITSLKRMLQKYKIDPKQYECEITESCMMENLPEDLAVLKEVNDMKVRLSIDDFGTGYASFDYLRKLSIQKLKIDMEFVSSIFDHKNNEIVLAAMIELGHRLKLQVLAEGIETKRQEEWLKKNKCDLGQGFYFSRPLPLNELIMFLKNEKKPSQKK